MLLVKKIKSVSSNDAPTENPHETDSLPEKHEQKKIPKGKIQKKKEQKENKPPKRKTLEDVADDLELTSLETDVGGEVQKIHNTLDVLRETHQVLHEESGTEEPSKDEQVQKTPRMHGEYQTQNPVLEKQLKFVQQDLYNANCRINQMENNFQWLWNYVQQMQCNATPQKFSGNVYCRQNAQAENVTATELVSELLDTSSVSLEGAPEMSADKCVGGYSNVSTLAKNNNSDIHTFIIELQQQLLNRINGMESYSKAALALFRLLFKEEEYIGRSLTGSKSRSGEAKPAVDQDRLGRIYNVIAQKFPHITPVMVRERLRDLVKPSRTKRH